MPGSSFAQRSIFDFPATNHPVGCALIIGEHLGGTDPPKTDRYSLREYLLDGHQKNLVDSIYKLQSIGFNLQNLTRYLDKTDGRTDPTQ